MYFYIFEHCNLIQHAYAPTWAHIHKCIHARIRLLCPSPASPCYTCSCYLLCCVLVGMCVAAAASWQSKNGLLVTLPLNLWQVCACTTCSCYPLWHSCAVWWWRCAWLLPAGSLRIACCATLAPNCNFYKDVLHAVAVLCWSGPFRSSSRPGPPMYHPWPSPRANGRFSHRLLLSHLGFGSLESCYAVLSVGGGTCVTGLKLSGQVHMVASGWRWLPVVS